MAKHFLTLLATLAFLTPEGLPAQERPCAPARRPTQHKAAEEAGPAPGPSAKLLAGLPTHTHREASAGKLLVSSPAWHVQLLRLLFQVVLAPELAAHPVRSLAAQTQLPEAALRQVLRGLARQGFWLEHAPPGTSPLLLPAPARYWLTHYAATLRRRLNAQRYRPRCPTALADWAQRHCLSGCLLSGPTAAQRLLGYSASLTSLTLYSRFPRPQLVQQLGLVPAAKGAIEILNAFAPLTCCAPTDPQCAPPLLVYADLLASPTPPAETLTHELRERYLGELWG